jgi:mannose-1-phosphate guanylyltransferase
MALHAIVMAGGAGTRFWPASRSLRPKQLLPLVGDVPLLAATVRRLAPRIPASHVYVATGTHLAEASAAIVPEVPRDQILAEPIPRNTAPCIAWATARIARRDPDAIVCVFPSDHHVEDEAGFLATVDRAVHGAHLGHIATIGIVPSRPETGYGYIEVGERIADGLHHAARFVEKPNLETAERYLREKPRFLWNAGMFFFRASVMLEAVRRHLPQLADGVARIDAAAGTQDEASVLAQVFPTLPSISIDYGVMEKERSVAVAPGDFGWNDLGSWESAWELAAKDAAGNAVPEGTVAVDARGNLVHVLGESQGKKVWALVGVQDLAIVETDDAVLVIPRDRAQDVRLVVEALKARGDTGRT